ncbi:hypothetical protein Tcur_3909 [Thermomonospora curvata DSM 43183]|jgi:hypothetical protein|uniref:Uncharacterized protein n=1 Tax=Thermomonospora curvata (strain ATCC 19995 / DSM 43183 / JCM 3096 / KCTC 9072 / NBRC 15933 / NCIMB 10081 / Henssen B9) TaxID=471852 RepID=D1AE12_THECD|nr:hypothetical protein Tcur_3909 [Thermomonospora curvata DSM 43183]
MHHPDMSKAVMDDRVRRMRKEAEAAAKAKAAKAKDRKK